MNIVDKFTESNSDDFDKFMIVHLNENSLQYAEDLLKYSLRQKDEVIQFSPEYMVYWSVQLSCEHHLVNKGVYERIHDINKSTLIVRKIK